MGEVFQAPHCLTQTAACLEDVYHLAFPFGLYHLPHDLTSPVIVV